MKTIMNYNCTRHFVKRIKERGIDPFMISLCLSKGEKKKENERKLLYVLKRDNLQEYVKQGYIDVVDYFGLDSITVIVKENVLVTAFARYSDVGIY